MKLKALSLLVPALLVAGAAQAAEIYNKDGNKLDLYGKVDGLHYFSKDKANDGDQSYVRMGVKGETQINSELTGYGRWEYEAKANSAEGENSDSNNYTRLAFAGLKFADYGSLDYGRNYGVVYDVTSWTDVLPEFGGDGGTYGVDNFLQSRAGGVLTYRNSDFFGLVDGLSFALQYQGKNSESEGLRHSPLTANGDGFGGSLTYDLGEGFSVGTAIASSKRTAEQNGMRFGEGKDATTYTGGLKYDANNIYLAAQYTQSYNATRFGENTDQGFDGFANKAQNIELVAQYQFDFGLRPSIAYLESKGKRIENGYNNQDLVKFIDLGATYDFNKNMSTYVDYKINLLKNNEFTQKAGINTDNVVALGLVYQF